MDEYKILYRAKRKLKSRFFEITHTDDPRCTLPWTVCYCGADYHFRNLYGALCYCYGRRFIDKYEIDALMEKLSNEWA